MITNNFTEFQNEIQILKDELAAKNQLIEKLQTINDDLNCTTAKVHSFLNEVAAEFIDPNTGAWITIKWYDVVKIKKGLRILFTFVKSTFKDCYNKEFLPRVSSWLELVLS